MKSIWKALLLGSVYTMLLIWVFSASSRRRGEALDYDPLPFRVPPV